jgi:hypothetical protein|tara:strand:- start:2797 stop:4368 length:1572 start_codon:yes stop_codon:yes gene_type:complete
MLEILLPPLRDGESWRLEYFKGKGAKRFFKIDKMEPWAVKRAAQGGLDVYFAVASFRAGTESRRVEDVSRLSCLWADLDVGEGKEHPTREHALEALKALELAPSALLDSGYGFHAFWALEAPEEGAEAIERVIRLVRGLAKRIGGDTNVADAARVMRIPGTFNYKHKTPAAVTLVDENDNTYTLQQFVDAGVDEIARVADSGPALASLDNGKVLTRDASLKIGSQMLALLDTTGNHADEYGSGSEADFAIICALLRSDHLPADVAATFVASKRGEDARTRKPGHFDDYIERTMESAQLAVGAERPDDNGLSSMLAKRRVEVTSEDRIALLAELGHLLADVQITEARRYLGDDPTFVLYTDGGVVRIGGWANVVNLNRFRVPFEGVTGEVIPKLDTEAWAQVRALILKASIDIEVHEESTEQGQVAVWVAEYLEVHPAASAQLQFQELRMEAIRMDNPFITDGDTCITLTGTKAFIKNVIGERIDRRDLARLLRAEGWASDKVNIMDDDRRTSKRVFRKLMKGG